MSGSDSASRMTSRPVARRAWIRPSVPFGHAGGEHARLVQARLELARALGVRVDHERNARDLAADRLGQQVDHVLAGLAAGVQRDRAQRDRGLGAQRAIVARQRGVQAGRGRGGQRAEHAAERAAGGRIAGLDRPGERQVEPVDADGVDRGQRLVGARLPRSDVLAGLLEARRASAARRTRRGPARPGRRSSSVLSMQRVQVAELRHLGRVQLARDRRGGDVALAPAPDHVALHVVGEHVVVAEEVVVAQRQERAVGVAAGLHAREAVGGRLLDGLVGVGRGQELQHGRGARVADRAEHERRRCGAARRPGCAGRPSAARPPRGRAGSGRASPAAGARPGPRCRGSRAGTRPRTRRGRSRACGSPCCARAGRPRRRSRP